MRCDLVVDGLTFKPAFFQDIADCTRERIEILRSTLLDYELEQRPIKLACGLDEGTFFGAHHFLRLDVLLEKFISNTSLIVFLNQIFRGPPILNSIGLSIVPPSNIKSGYVHGQNVHRDQRSFHDSEVPRNIWILVMLDDFSVKNGATLLYKNSHRFDDFIADEGREFRAVGRVGDCIVYDGRTYHTSMPNYTSNSRVAMTISFTPAYIKPQFDYLSLYKMSELNSMNQGMLQMLGYFSRVPSTLADWYAVPEKRFYRRDQG